jgi:hypothetical protein
MCGMNQQVVLFVKMTQNDFFLLLLILLLLFLNLGTILLRWLPDLNMEARNHGAASTSKLLTEARSCFVFYLG